ncbi:MAG: hypothetical protein IM592_17445 [Bacteroidetes bacterium]|nr:hypothetical protein [Bacteroidota bacterium]
MQGIDHIRKEKTITKAHAELKIVQPQMENYVEESLNEKIIKKIIDEGIKKNE